MKAVTKGMFLAGGLLLAACQPSGPSAIEVSLDTSPDTGTTMACKASTSGTCHALFVSGADVTTLSADVGKTATASAIRPGTGFCVDVTAPDPERCKPQPLPSGVQIIRNQRVGS